MLRQWNVVDYGLFYHRFVIPTLSGFSCHIARLCRAIKVHGNDLARDNFVLCFCLFSPFF